MGEEDCPCIDASWETGGKSSAFWNKQRSRAAKEIEWLMASPLASQSRMDSWSPRAAVLLASSGSEIRKARSKRKPGAGNRLEIGSSGSRSTEFTDVVSLGSLGPWIFGLGVGTSGSHRQKGVLGMRDRSSTMRVVFLRINQERWDPLERCEGPLRQCRMLAAALVSRRMPLEWMRCDDFVTCKFELYEIQSLLSFASDYPAEGLLFCV